MIIMIVSFRVKEMESKVFMEPDEISKYKGININYDVNVKNCSVVERETPFGKKAILKVDYMFSINYLSPNIGQIRFEGSSDYFDENQNMKELKEQWDSGKAPVEVQNEIANNIVHNLAPLAITISQRLGLPPSVPLPSINFQKQAKPPEFTHYHA